VSLQGELIAARYEVADLVGAGGMADVYRARDRVLERNVAVKVLRLTAPDTSARKRFAAEARTLARLSHPGLVTVLDAGIEDERPYLVLELIDGPTLTQQLRSGGPLADARVRVIGSQLADAIAHAHGLGVIHRDVKPGNILLRPDGRVVLTDFGIAQMLTDAVHHTRTGEVIGSPAYLAPEQVNGAAATGAADIYALGLVLLECLTGHRAYDGPPIEAAIARLSTPPAFPTSMERGLRDLLRRMTALDPAERPTAAEVAAALVPSPILEAPDATAMITADHLDLASTTAVMSPVPRRRRRRLLLGAAAAAIIAALVVVGSAQLRPDEVAATPPATPSTTASTTPSATPSATPTPKAQTVVAKVPSPAARPRVTKPKPPKKHAGPVKHKKPHGKTKGKARH
jgi:serine/threonine protein kinase